MSRFTKKGLLFDDGSTLDADVLVFATGYDPSVLEGHGSANVCMELDMEIRERATELSLVMSL